MTKTISLSDEAYELLSSLRQPGESFSELATRLARRARQERIVELSGSWPYTSSDAAGLKSRIYQVRDENGRRKPLFRPEVIKNRYDPEVAKRGLDDADDEDADD